MRQAGLNLRARAQANDGEQGKSGCWRKSQSGALRSVKKRWWSAHCALLEAVAHDQGFPLILA